jgi:hypothetical protein
MTIIRNCSVLALGGFVFAGVMCWSGETRPSTAGDLFSQAEARVGRPATPVSYAGVARRTTRRVAYTGAAAATAAAAHPPPPPPPPPQTTVVVTTPPQQAVCTEIVDTTGKVIKPCP